MRPIRVPFLFTLAALASALPAQRGHRVEVATTCALRYADWADHYPPGESDHVGVPHGAQLPVQQLFDDNITVGGGVAPVSSSKPAGRGQ